jgi:ribonuclease BN (tRNA processing enzyme)
VVTDGKSTVAFSSDTAATDELWSLINRTTNLNALFIEASFPNSMHELAKASKHLTPQTMAEELTKLSHNGIDILAVHLKPAYRATLVIEIQALGIKGLNVMEAGRVYEF